MVEFNPNHRVTQAMHDQWHKICALLMMKMGQKHVIITPADIENIGLESAIAVQELPDGIHIRLVDEKTALRLAREEGGLPV